MEHTVLVNFIVFLSLVFTLFSSVVYSLPRNYDSAIDTSNMQKEGEDKPSPLWFGPRLGRKKRNPPLNDNSRNVDEQKVKELLDTVEDYPWAIVAVNGNRNIEAKRHTYSFTPRLGRTLEDNRWISDESDLVERSPPFAPRLGRRTNPYSPRLGRDDRLAFL